MTTTTKNKMIYNTKLLLVFVSTLFCITAKAQKTDPDFQKIDSIVTASAPIKFNGVVLVSQNGKTKYVKAYGYKDFDGKIPLKANDRFEIMSNSKQITAVLVLQEAEKGALDLQTPIKKYLPSLTQPWADTVTIHHLLNHTHGIVDTEKPLVFKPGSQFKYGNLSYILLGKILERTSKKSFTELSGSLFKKLKMKNTFCFNGQNNHSLVPGYMNSENHFSKVEKSFLNEELLPAAGMISTVQDLAKWDQALYKGKLLSPKYLGLMMKASTSSQHNVFGKENMGFGYSVRVIKEAGLDYFGITGLGDGFTCLNVYFPSADTSLIILENQLPKNSDFWSFKEASIKNTLLKSKILK
jgi:D-alanyl-D-alanine carboxypeptidase